ncbi:DUF6080 domain-containing protein [Chryseobacterium taklimakanense]|uniref:DUF6080 domain-containing protein n=1 Tax=Chryseobacterium taklimakanense TaxID=536441 RepID=UPI0023F7E995|nr:DUF6080 domain-containing protein [Chryseobacterium taklimakanense]
MNLKQKTADVFQTVFPSRGEEFLVFSGFMLLYGILATKIALGYTIIFDNRIPWDAYFSFDNRAIVMTGGGFERHPLANYFFGWIREFALLVSGGKMDANFRLVLAWFSVVTVSLSLVQIYKYLRNITKLPIWLSYLIVVFFSLFSTNILLSFTPETYTYTLFFLCLFNYYAALKLRKDEKISMLALTAGTVAVGGLTVTNAVKVFIPVLFEKEVFKNFKNFGNAVLRGIVAVAVFALLFMYRLNFDYMKFLSKTGEQYEKFSKPKVTPLWDMMASWFLGGNVLFSNFITRDYHNRNGFEYKALFMDVYSSWIPYIFIAVLLALVIWAYIKNFKNKLVQILMISFAVDIIIHCILKFGLHTSYIYGGHFVFVYPLLLGWLCYSYRNSPKKFSAILILVITMTVYLGINNFIRLEEFFSFLNAFYQK